MSKEFLSFRSGKNLRAVLARAITGSAILRIAGIGLTFFVGIQLARGLGAEGYGIYGVAMAVIAILMVPTEFGLPQLLTREVASAHARGDYATIRGVLGWATKVSLGLGASIVCFMGVWLATWGGGFDSPLSMTLLAGAVMIPAVAQVAMRSAALRGMRQIVKGDSSDVLLRPLFYSLLIFMVPWFIGPLTPAMAMALGAASAGIALIFAESMLRTALPPSTAHQPMRSAARAWWTSALPMAATNGLGVLRGQLLILMLGFLVTTADVGNYRISTSIVGLVLFPVSLLNMVFAPYIASFYVTEDFHSLKKVLFYLPFGSAVGVLMLSIPFFHSGDWLITAIFGKEFMSASHSLLILCFGLFISNLFGGNVVLLNMTGHHRDVMLISVASLGILSVLGYFLINLFGISGAAITYVLSNIFSDVLMWWVAKRRLGLGASIFLLLSVTGRAKSI